MLARMGGQLGIDLGTTWTAAAFHRSGRVEIVSLGDRAPTIPSVLFIREDGVVLTGDAANRRAITEPGRVAREFKRRLGDPTPLIVGGVPYPAEVLTAKLLRWVVDKVVELEGETPDSIALTHPANWGTYKQDLLRQAVRHADLDANAVTFLAEPQAAAIYYASQERVSPGAIIAVYDLGGGTFDAAVLRKETDAAGGFEILGEPEGIERLGGIDFDAAVLAHVNAALDNSLDALDVDDASLLPTLARIRQDCVEAKEILSVDTDVSVGVSLPGVQHEVRLTRSEFEEMIRPVISETIAALRRAVRSAGVEPTDVQAVLLVGGSSRIPIVGQMVSAELNRPVAVDAHPKHSVALGAAIAAASAAGAGSAETITPVIGDREPPVTASIPIVVPATPALTPIVAPPPPPPSEATRRVIIPAPPQPTPQSTGARPAPSSSAPRRGPSRGLVAVAALVLIALVALAVVLLAGRDDGTPAVSSSSAPGVDPASAEPANLQPGRPPGVADPAAPASSSPMVALRHGTHVGFERVAVDFGDVLPPRIQSVEPDATLGRIRVVLDQPRPTEASAPVRLDVGSSIVTSVFYVVDAGRTYVDVFTNEAVEPIAFRLGNVAFKDGSAKGIVVIDVVPSTQAVSWGGQATIGSGGMFHATTQGTKLHLEGYGVRASGKGIVRLLDASNAEVRKLTVVLTASAPVNGVFRTDVDLAGLATGEYTVEFTSDNGDDDIDGQRPSTNQVVSLP
ncbi:MAG: molecular chaperone DnaK [Acidimicrobiaceae bacterium]